MRHDILNATQQRGWHTAIPAQKKVRKPINQLIRENNQAAGKTWKWSYDNAGNILSKTEYAYTTGTLGTAVDTVNYTYGDSAWGDLLTSYNGNTIDYEENSGNPTDDGTWTYTWEHGRQLASMSNGTTAWSFTYDANGMRTSRSSSTASYTYVYNGGQLSKMTYSGLSDATMYFTYDASGRPAVVTYNDVPYYYVTNLQGDVVAILNSTGTAVVQYTYDAWGKLLSTTGTMASTLGAYNPLRYRSYVYDAELGLYYLQSRYYNPTIGRFLNADALVSTGQGVLGNNMFAYCGNNPASRTDASGHAFIQVDYNFDDLPNDLFPEIGGGCAGSVAGGVAILSGLKHSEDEDTRVLFDVFTAVLAADELKDLQDANKTLDKIMVVKKGRPIVKIITGVKRIANGVGLLAAPAPTFFEDYIGYALVESGARAVILGVVELIAELLD